MPTYASFIVPQFRASLTQLRACIEVCPEPHWRGTIGRYPFWHVAFHALMFVDCYLAPGNDAFVPRLEFLPAGRAELEEEFPSREMSRAELLRYADALLTEVAPGVERETEASLAGPSGFSHLPISRAELHVYNLRHVQHHTGQLSAFLRRAGVDVRWVKTA